MRKKFNLYYGSKGEGEKGKLCVHIGYWLLSGVWHYGEIWGERSNYILLGFVCPTFLPFSAFHFYSFFLSSINIPRDFSFYLCCMFVGKLCCLFDVSGLLRITVW